MSTERDLLRSRMGGPVVVNTCSAHDYYCGFAKILIVVSSKMCLDRMHITVPAVVDPNPTNQQLRALEVRVHGAARVRSCALYVVCIYVRIIHHSQTYHAQIYRLVKIHARLDWDDFLDMFACRSSVPSSAG